MHCRLETKTLVIHRLHKLILSAQRKQRCIFAIVCVHACIGPAGCWLGSCACTSALPCSNATAAAACCCCCGTIDANADSRHTLRDGVCKEAPEAEANDSTEGADKGGHDVEVEEDVDNHPGHDEDNGTHNGKLAHALGCCLGILLLLATDVEMVGWPINTLMRKRQTHTFQLRSRMQL